MEEGFKITYGCDFREWKLLKKNHHHSCKNNIFLHLKKILYCILFFVFYFGEMSYKVTPLDVANTQ